MIQLHLVSVLLDSQLGKSNKTLHNDAMSNIFATFINTIYDLFRNTNIFIFALYNKLLSQNTMVAIDISLNKVFEYRLSYIRAQISSNKVNITSKKTV